jgi:hypothetical protein
MVFLLLLTQKPNAVLVYFLMIKLYVVVDKAKVADPVATVDDTVVEVVQYMKSEESAIFTVKISSG